MIFVVDNYDSFTFNLAHLVRCASGCEVVVERSDRVAVADVLAARPRAVVISPGPGRPGDRGIAVDLARAAAGRVPLLGVCLGHQAIAAAFGARIVRGPEPVHGKASPVHHRGAGPFRGLPDPFPAMRYHSLVVDRESLPPELEVTAWLEDGTVMGIGHRRVPCQGIQFHPESFLTPDGALVMAGFLARAGIPLAGGTSVSGHRLSEVGA